MTQLFGVPEPFAFEAVSAWLPRLALSQGAPLPEVASFLGVNLRGDVDRKLIGEPLDQVRRVCSLPNSAFATAERIMQSLDLIEPMGDRFMARKAGRSPRFRFCVCCLSEMKTPHFPIQWRFIAWRRCPLHDCLLEDACPNCDAPIVFPTCVQESMSGKAGYAGLDHCLTCSKRLTSVLPCRLEVNDVRLINQWEEEQLANGRALLAALVRQRFRVEGRSVNFHLRSLAVVMSKRAFPERFDWLSPAMLRTRVSNGYPMSRTRTHFASSQDRQAQVCSARRGPAA